MRHFDAPPMQRRCLHGCRDVSCRSLCCEHPLTPRSLHLAFSLCFGGALISSSCQDTLLTFLSSATLMQTFLCAIHVARIPCFCLLNNTSSVRCSTTIRVSSFRHSCPRSGALAPLAARAALARARGARSARGARGAHGAAAHSDHVRRGTSADLDLHYRDGACEQESWSRALAARPLTASAQHNM